MEWSTRILGTAQVCASLMQKADSFRSLSTGFPTTEKTTTKYLSLEESHSPRLHGMRQPGRAHYACLGHHPDIQTDGRRGSRADAGMARYTASTLLIYGGTSFLDIYRILSDDEFRKTVTRSAEFRGQPVLKNLDEINSTN